MTLQVSAHLVVKLKLKKAIKFRAGRMRFCWDLSHLVVVCCLSSSLIVSQQQLYNHTAYASFPYRWNLSVDSNRAFNFTNGFVLPILHSTHNGSGFGFGFGLYGNEAEFPRKYFLSVFMLPCDYADKNVSDDYCPPLVVWSANRNSPVKNGSALELNSDGDMVLKDADKTVVWSTNTSGKTVSGVNLTELGNLVLLDRNNASVWESFSHPMDSLVPGQKMVVGQKLKPSVSATNLSEFGLLSLSITPQGLIALLETEPPQVYYEYIDKPIFNQFVSFEYIIKGRSVYVESLGLDPNVVAGRAYMKFSSDGHLRVYVWQGTEWQVVADLLTEQVGECGYPLVCGRYGICADGQCSCPAPSNRAVYFKQISDAHPELGCSETSPLSCGDPPDATFLELPGIGYFDSGLELQNVTVETCKEACSKNCSCKSAFFHPPTNTSDYTKCSLQSEVFSLMSSEDGSSAYIKVHRGISSRRQHENQLPLILGSSIGSFIILSGVLLFFIGKKKRANEMEEEDYLDQLPGMPTRFSYDDLKTLTDNFSTKLGEGGFGSVFEGTLTDGMRVAVKHLHGLGQIKNSFLAEVKSIGSIHHINLVSLVGFCADKSHRLLVYEYMGNGSLEKWVFRKNNKSVLNWQQRRKIIFDIAKGLNYLHEECKQKIIHLDIKPQNILLDENLNAKISDFGLSKLVDRDKSQVVTTMRGTPGYLAPEWLSAVITEKVDVYSFGVVTLEILCGRKIFDISLDEEDRNLLCLFKRKAEEDRFLDMVDEYLDNLQLYGVEAVKMMKLASWCLQADYTRRPSMSTVVKVLDGAMVVEGELDYNFWTRPVRVGHRENAISATATQLPSILSGPR